MPSNTLTELREKYPQLENVPDNVLTVELGNKYPDWLSTSDDEQFKKEYEDYTSTTLGGIASQAAYGAERIPDTLARSVSGTVEALSEDRAGLGDRSIYDIIGAGIGSEIIGDAIRYFKGVDDISEGINEAAKEYTDYLDEQIRRKQEGGLVDRWFQAEPEFTPGSQSEMPTAVESFGGVVSDAAGSIIPQLASGNLPGAMMTGGLQVFGSTYADASRAYEEDGDPNAKTKALSVALSDGIKTALITKAGNYLAGKWGGVDADTLLKELATRGPVRAGLGGYVKTVIPSLTAEGVEEYIDEGLSAAGAKFTYNPEMTWEEVLDTAMQAGLAGALIGKGSASLQYGVNYVRANRVARELRAAGSPQTAEKVVQKAAETMRQEEEARAAEQTRMPQQPLSVAEDSAEAGVLPAGTTSEDVAPITQQQPETAPVEPTVEEQPAVQQPEAEPQPTVEEVEATTRKFNIPDEDIEIDGNIDEESLGQLEQAVQAVRNRFGSALGLQRLEVRQSDRGAGVSTPARNGVSDTIFIDPARIKQSQTVEGFSLEKAIEEEMLHNVEAQALTREFGRRRAEGLIDESVSEADFIRSELEGIAKSMTRGQRDAARGVYGQDFIDDAHMAQEFVRQLVQKKHTGSVTEEAYNNSVIQKFLQMISRILRGMKVRDNVKQHIGDIDSLIAEFNKVELANAPTDSDKQAITEQQQQAAVAATEAENNQYLEEVIKSGKFARAVDRYLDSKGLYLPDSEKEIAVDNVMDSFTKFIQDGNLAEDFNTQKVATRSALNRIRAISTQKRGEGNVVTTSEVEDTRASTTTTPAGESARQLVDKFVPEMGLTQDEIDAIPVFFGEKTIQQYKDEHPNLDKSRVSQIVKDPNRKMGDLGLLETKIVAYARKNREFAEALRDINQQAQSEPETYAADPLLKQLDRITSKVPNTKERLFKFFRPELRLKSIVDPEEEVNIHQSKIDKDGYINKTLNTVKTIKRDLEKAIKAEYGKKLTADDLVQINDALNGVEGALEGSGYSKPIPDKVANVVANMRSQIDALSRYVVNKGWVSEELRTKIDENIGVYLARSYRIFDDPEFKNEIKDTEIYNRAVNFVRTNSEVDEATAKRIVNEFLEEASQRGSRDKFNAGAIGSKDLSLFMKKKDIVPEFRALMGEYKDPFLNYTRTVSRLAHFIGNQQFLMDAKERGMGKIFFKPEDAPEQATAVIAGKPKDENVENAPASRSRYSPLAGLRTTPEIKQILEEGSRLNQMLSNDFFAGLAKLNVYTKSTKTIGSVMTHARNIVGQPYFMFMNGINPADFKLYGKAIRTIWADAKGDNKKLQQYFNKLTELGVVGEEITTSELKRVLNENVEEGSRFDSISGILNYNLGKNIGLWSKAKAGSKKGVAALTRIYRASDEMGKIYAFEMERQKLAGMKGYEGYTDEQLDKAAAERVRATFPTYSEMPEAIQKLRSQPFVGPFMSFAYESMRTQINAAEIAVEEYKKGNKAYALRRIAGMVAVNSAGSYMLKLMSDLLGGVSEEEQDDARSLLPFYEDNSRMFFYRDDESGKINYINFSFNNPYSSTGDPLNALIGINGVNEADTYVGQVASALIEAAEPFIGETIAASLLIDLLRNQDIYGNKVYLEETTGTEKAKAIGKRLLKGLLPGSLDRGIFRFPTAYAEGSLESGETPVLSNELLAEFTGLKIRTIDYKEKLATAAKQNVRRLSEANFNFNKKAGSAASGVSESQMISSYEVANQARFEIFKDIARQVNAARLGGLSDGEILRAYQVGKMSKVDAVSVLRNQYRAMPISSSVATRARDAGHPIPMKEIKAIAKEYNRRPLDE